MKSLNYRGTHARRSTLAGRLGLLIAVFVTPGLFPTVAPAADPVSHGEPAASLNEAEPPEASAKNEPAVAQPTAPKSDAPSERPPAPKLPDPKDATRVNPGARVWVNRAKGRVMVDGVVSLRRGLLEMFACPRGTKEHESIVAVDSPAFLVHAALLSVGAKPGTPVQWEPKFKPPTGDRIDITVQWRDLTPGEDGAPAVATERPIQSADARSWVRDLDSNQSMRQHWVFAGSGFWKDEQTGREFYLAESGDMICVSNFGTAMLDVPDNSPQSNEGLMFEAFTERVPALGTPVRLVLTPKPKAEGGRGKAAPSAKQPLPSQGRVMPDR